MRRLALPSLLTALALGQAACGSNESDGGKKTTVTDAGGGAQTCPGAFAQLPFPYTLNALMGSGEFVADGTGLVFPALPDSSASGQTSDYPVAVMASDLTGGLTTLFTTNTAMILDVAADETAVYFGAGLLGASLLKIPRAGGTPTVLVDSDLHAGPVLVGDTLYYAGIDDGMVAGIYAMPKSGGAATLLSARGAKDVSALATDGQGLYWIEDDGLLSKSDNVVYRLDFASGAVELFGTFAYGSGVGTLAVGGGAVYSSGMTDALDTPIWKMSKGQAPQKVVERSNMMVVFDAGYLYYGAGSGGLMRSPVDFSTTTTVPGSAGRSVWGIGIGPTDIWYAEKGCIYRAPK